MKKATALLTLIATMGLVASSALAQVEGDYRTRNSGDWSAAQNWMRYNGSAWAPIGDPPQGSETITVMEEDSIFVNTSVSITGRLINQGIVAEDETLTIEDGGVYQHDRDEGSVPRARWNEGSTFHITGIAQTTPANRNQSYHHIVFETPDQLANFNMDLNDVTIGGDIRVIETGLGRWYLTSAEASQSARVEILGDVIVEGGNFAVHGTSNALTEFVVDHYGDIIVTGGNFSISRGTQGNGTTMWNLHEGDFSIDNASTQNSTATPAGARFVFQSGASQTMTVGEGTDILALPIAVLEGTTVDFGASVLTGSGDFEVFDGAIVGTAREDGVAGMFDGLYVGNRTLHDGSGYLFNGTSAQVTSGLMPETIGDLIIDNAEGVTLSQETTLNGVLRLVSGVFNNAIPLNLGPDATVSEEGGSALHPVSSDTDLQRPVRFFVDQNYPNPFNPSTTLRFGLPSHSEVGIQVYNVLGQHVHTVMEGELPAGTHEVTVDLGGLSTGVYLYRITTETNEITRRMVLLK